MAAKPIERFVKKQIQEQGGWARILERLGSGETVADIARSLKRPDGIPPSRNFLSMLLHADAERSKQVEALREREAPDALVDGALHDVEAAAVDRDSVNHAKVKADLKLKVAGFMSRARWGERPTQVNVQVNANEFHLEALRHRIIEASRPLATALAETAEADGLAVQASQAVTVRTGETEQDSAA